MSEEQLRDQTHERWRETLELLGLAPPGETSTPPSQPAPAPAAQRSIPETESTERPEPLANVHDEPEAIWSPAPVNEEDSSDITITEADDSVEEDEPAEPASEFEDPHSRGRRRGRRGSRARSQRAEGNAASTRGEASSQRQGDFEPAEDAEPRGRDRYSPGSPGDTIEESPEPEPEEYAEEENEAESDAEVKAEEKPGEQDEEPDTLSDWNVPSWQELISSLYRPDR